MLDLPWYSRYLALLRLISGDLCNDDGPRLQITSWLISSLKDDWNFPNGRHAIRTFSEIVADGYAAGSCVDVDIVDSCRTTFAPSYPSDNPRPRLNI
jgi:hypothetical protein